MKLTAHRFALLFGLCCALLLAVATATPAGSAATNVGGATAGSAPPAQLSTAPLNPAYLQALVSPLFASPSSATGGQGLGLRPGPQDLSYSRGMEVPATRNAPLRGALPATYDLRSFSRVTSVKNQGSFGTCWSFASSGSLESGLLPGESLDFSEDNMVLTSGFNCPGTLYDAGGQIWMSTAYLTRWGGPVYESEDAYGDNKTPAGLTPRKHVQEVNWIPGRGSSLDNDNVKNAIMQYGGAYVAFGWYGSSGGSAYYNASTASYYYNGSSGSNHAVLIVGWDDAYPAANFATAPAGNGAFIVKNSWGTSWGSSGYFYVSYYDATFGRDVMGVFDNAESTGNYAGIYQYDPLGDCSELGYGNATGWFANVFTAQSAASLSAVGFYTTTPGTSYEVYTGATLATKTLRTTGTQAYMGYHTVALPTPITVTGGQSFVVAVKVTSPGTTWPIAFEAPYANYSSAASASAGQSFVSSSGSSWTDLTTISGYANANVCLKAYTTTAVIPPPTLTGFTPASGLAGTSVTLTGTGLAGATAVRFNGTAASFGVDSATQITAVVPAAASSGSVAVTTPGGVASSVASFTVTPSPIPTLTGFSPASGLVGTRVTLTGTGLTGATAVRFNGTVATFSVDSPTQITATVPATATSGTIAVTTPGGSATSVASFTVIPAPTLSGFTPASGLVGTSVTLTGTGLAGATAVRFNGTVATFGVDSPTQITATVPATATSGTISVTTPGGSATSVSSFTVVVTSKATLKLSGLKSGALTLGKSVTARGKVTPVSLAGSTVKLTTQLRKNGKWVNVKSVFATSSLTGAYSWKYKPAKKGAYRARATITRTTTCTAATTKWLTFTVK